MQICKFQTLAALITHSITIDLEVCKKDYRSVLDFHAWENGDFKSVNDTSLFSERVNIMFLTLLKQSDFKIPNTVMTSKAL